jgi:hypothetical protein
MGLGGHGETEGPFTELGNLTVERDPRFPIHMTIQFCALQQMLMSATGSACRSGGGGGPPQIGVGRRSRQEPGEPET